jgi:hypothetical protein
MPPDATQELFAALIIVNAVAVVAGMTINVILQRRIKTLSPARWEALGFPDLFFNNSIGSSLRFLRYVYGTSHFELNDSLVNRLALVSKLLFCFVCIILGSVFATILYEWHVHPISTVQGVHGPSVHNHPLNRYGAAILAIIAASLAAMGWFFLYLKRAHTQVWIELGSPSLFMNNTIGNGWKVGWFILSGRHKSLADPKLTFAIYAIRLMYGVIIVALFVLGPLASK